MSYSGMDFSHAQLDVLLGQFGPKSPLAKLEGFGWIGPSSSHCRLWSFCSAPSHRLCASQRLSLQKKPGFRQKHCEAFTSRCFNAWQNKDDSCSSSLCALRKQSRALSFENRILPYIRHIASPTTFLQRHREKVLQLWSPDRRRRFHPAVEITCFGKAARCIATGGGIWGYGLLCRYCIHLYMICIYI